MWAEGSVVGNETLRFYMSQMKSLKLTISQKFSSHEKAMSIKINQALYNFTGVSCHLILHIQNRNQIDNLEETATLAEQHYKSSVLLNNDSSGIFLKLWQYLFKCFNYIAMSARLPAV